MTPEQAALAKQLASLPGFRWQQGMVLTYPGGTDAIRAVDSGGHPTVYDINAHDSSLRDGVCADVDDPAPEELAETGDTLIDLTSDATGGVLLGWLAAMGMQPTADCDAACWDVGAGMPTKWRWSGNSTTLAEACARALVAIGRCA